LKWTSRQRLNSQRVTHSRRRESLHFGEEHGNERQNVGKHYGHTTNVTSAAELTKGGTFKGDKNKASAIDWL